MKTDELRERYLEFFASKDHARRPSDVLVPRDDPTVLFTPAGMNQFKNQFLGVGQLDFPRAVTCQKCLRTGDIQNVGLTAYHHTFFEMLGNFSFGDYFKHDAISWAWEFLTDPRWLGLAPERLSATVYNDDDEAWQIWSEVIGLPESRLRRDDEYENFWPAGAPSGGPDGVCGPCSEIFYQPESGSSPVEIWNLVFTQFNRVGDPPDNLRPLPKKNIDTGMGLERTAAVLQGVESNFEIDILRPLCVAAGEVLGLDYTFDGDAGRPLRRIADHLRAVTFCIHEGVEPGNDKETYVVRQLLRRASLEGFLLGCQEPFLFELVPAIASAMKGGYPDLLETTEPVANVIREEESQFLAIIDRGIREFESILASTRADGRESISGEDAFDLHQTHGFLIELTEAMAARTGLPVDRSRFDELMDRQRQVSGAGAFADSVMAAGPLDELRTQVGGTGFDGYSEHEVEARIVGIIAEGELVERWDRADPTAVVAAVLDRSVFYGEAGGQVGDSGRLVADGFEFIVRDTQRDGELLLHIGHLERGEINTGDTLAAAIDIDRRAGIRRAHSATHLLHHALRNLLGSGAMQRGSKVECDALRFDFAHSGSLSTDESRRIEDEINRRIAEGTEVTTRVMPLEEAREAGAMALFGEKYPDLVRVVTMGDFSVELCGGTHLANTGQVGLCRIVSEEPVAKGVRRISALTGPRAIEQIREAEDLLDELVLALRTSQPADLPQRVATLQDELREARQQQARSSRRSIAGITEELLTDAETVEGVRIVTHLADNLDRETLRELADRLRDSAPPIAVLLGAAIDGKAAMLAAVSRELIDRGLSAADCVRTAAAITGGGGGGRPDLAEAGGREPDKLPEALEAGAAYYRGALGT